MAKYETFPNPNPNGKRLVDCSECGERKEHHAKGLCGKCYKKQYKPKVIKCRNCGRMMPHHGHGMCASCDMRLHNYDAVLKYNVKKGFGLTLEEYRNLTKSCISCGFSKIVELHHLDGNKKNNEHSNLIPLCPNCHKMIHSHAYNEEIIENLENKGIKADGFLPRRL